jgi:S-adenosylmethionine decarboxylase
MSNTLSSKSGDITLIPVGTHCILELYGCPEHLLNDVVVIKQALKEAAKSARSTLLDEVSYQFSPHGVTALALLAESHISIHTWPERGYLAADVFTCGEHTKPEDACQFLLETFRAQNHSFLKLPRGRSITDIRHIPMEDSPLKCLTTPAI